MQLGYLLAVPFPDNRRYAFIAITLNTSIRIWISQIAPRKAEREYPRRGFARAASPRTVADRPLRIDGSLRFPSTDDFFLSSSFFLPRILDGNLDKFPGNRCLAEIFIVLRSSPSTFRPIRSFMVLLGRSHDARSMDREAGANWSGNGRTIVIVSWTCATVIEEIMGDSEGNVRYRN